MSYIFNIIFRVCIMEVFFFSIFSQVKFYLKMYCKKEHLLLIKKVVACFDKKIEACRKKSTDHAREESITEDPE